METERLHLLVKEKRWRELKDELIKLHPVDLARFLRELSTDERKRVLKTFPAESLEQLLPELPVDLLIELILTFPSRKSARLLSELPSDEMADVLRELPPEIRKNVFRHFSKKDTEEARDLLKYPSDTAGGLMTTEVLYLDESVAVKEAMAYIKKKAKEFETIYYIYLVDKGKKLRGVVSLRDLVLAPAEARLIDIGQTEIVSVQPGVDQEEVARIMARYDYFGLPVVDQEKTLLGMVTVDDVVDVIIDEATEDITRIGGTLPLKESYLFSSPYALVRSRVVWLLLLFVAASITSTVIKRFETVLTTIVSLAFFIPLIVDTGGNTGSQSATLVIRGMATGEVKYKHIVRIMTRELFVGAMLGLLVAFFGLLLAVVTNVPNFVAVTVAVTITAVVIVANLMGAILPMAIKKVGYDPAIVSAPLLTTIVDTIGLLIYFTVAALLFL